MEDSDRTLDDRGPEPRRQPRPWPWGAQALTLVAIGLVAAWLVLLTGLSWLVLLSFRPAARPTQGLAYGLLLISLAYSHPLGLFMIAAHGLAYLLVRPALRLPLRWWLMIQLAVVLAIVPWL